MSAFGAGLFGIPAWLMLMAVTALTVVGIPLVALEGVLFLLGFLYGWLAISGVMSRWTWARLGKKSPSLFWSIAAGSLMLIIALGFLGAIPALGKMLVFLTFLFILLTGFGAVLLNAFGYRPGWLYKIGRKREGMTK